MTGEGFVNRWVRDRHAAVLRLRQNRSRLLVVHESRAASVSDAAWHLRSSGRALHSMEMEIEPVGHRSDSQSITSLMSMAVLGAVESLCRAVSSEEAQRSPNSRPRGKWQRHWESESGATVLALQK